LRWSRDVTDGREKGRGEVASTYSVTGTELLLRRDGTPAAHGCVESRLAAHDCLAVAAAATHLASNLGNGIPVVRHPVELWGGDVRV
jgi:hypothetical protein